MTKSALRGSTSGTRHATTDTSGGFRYQGLDPGVPYSLTVSRAGYFDRESEPLTFGEAAVDSVAILVEAKECLAQGEPASASGRLATSLLRPWGRT